MKPFLVLDTETGGLDPALHGLTEIAGVLAAHPGDWSSVEIQDRFSVLIRPVVGLTYTPRALEIQHRTMTDLQRHGLPEPEAVLRFYCWLHALARRYDSLRIYAHNAGFDRDFILAAHERLNEGAQACDHIMFPVATDWRCTVDMFRRLKIDGVHDCPNAKLDTVMAHYGLALPADRRHTATADCEVTAQAVACMMRGRRDAPQDALLLGAELITP